MHDPLLKQNLQLRPGAPVFLLAVLLGIAFAVPIAHAQTYSVLYNFTGIPDGQNPYAGLIKDSSGNLYGTTLVGGTAGGYGTVFKIDSAGTESLLHSFDRTDGYLLFATVLRDKSGNLYGTSEQGGTSGEGVVFKLSKSGKLTVLHNFAGGASDGCLPLGGVTMDAKGNLYGTTSLCGGGYGEVWKLNKKGKLTVLHGFKSGSTDGAVPEVGNLLIDKKGNLYGVTVEGGPADSGVVYELSPTGKFTLLYAFAGGANDGCFPSGTLTMDARGALYGTTQECGSSGKGIVWKVSGGKEAVLYNFTGGSDGSNPYAGVILDGNSNLYGTASAGGASGDGVVFEVSPGGNLSVLHTFAGSDGASPYCSLLHDAQGNLYGTANAGGSDGDGVVWKITP
jgi:uncharacterized repeat protein (TIGR03803 family)